MKKFIHWLAVLSLVPIALSAQSADSQNIFDGLFLEIGPGVVGHCYPYDAKIFKREVISRLGGKAIHQFTGQHNDPEAAAVFNCALGYKLSDFILTTGFYYCSPYEAGTRDVINTYSYYWADPNASCINEGINTGCELSLIWLGPFYFYFANLEYNFWHHFSLKLQGGTTKLTLKQGRETWGAIDKEVEQTIYQETVYSGTTLLVWTTNWVWLNPDAKVIPVRCFLEGGWGYTKGQHTDGGNYHFAFKINFGLWNTK
ncbi:MAG: hypothetical protein V1765_01860 [bacterium]